MPCRRAPVTVREVRALRHGGDDGLPVQPLPEIDDLLLEPDDLLLQDGDFSQKLQCLGTAQFTRRRKSEGNCFETATNYGSGLLVKLIEKAKKGTDLRRQERGEARQRAQRPRERPLQSSVDVLLVPQLLPQLVHLQLKMENAACPQQKRNGHGLTVRTPGRTREIRTSCCSAIFLSLRDWLLFLIPCGVAIAGDAFMATGAVFELGGLLCSFSIALNRENNRKGKEI